MTSPRDAMVETTVQLLRRQGMNATGIQEVVERSGAPRGSVYHHFPGGKTELVIEAVQRAGQLGSAVIAGFTSRAPDPCTAALRLISHFERNLVESDFNDGCPLAAVALESSGADGQIVHAVADAFNQWLSPFEAMLIETGFPRRAARETSETVLALVEGATILARVQRSVRPLRSARNAVKQLLG